MKILRGTVADIAPNWISLGCVSKGLMRLGEGWTIDLADTDIVCDRVGNFYIFEGCSKVLLTAKELVEAEIEIEANFNSEEAKMIVADLNALMSRKNKEEQ